MQRHTSGTMAVSGSSETPLVTAGVLGSMVILGSVVVGQPAAWWAGLGFGLFYLWQFRVPRVSRGPAGAPQLHQVVLSTEHSFNGRNSS